MILPPTRKPSRDSTRGRTSAAYSKRASGAWTPTVTTLTALTAQEVWRLTHFGTAQDSSNAAGTFDANGDGEANLMEFATGQNPHAATRATPVLVKNGNTLNFTYTRSNAALTDGILFTVEWNDTFATGVWSHAGVTEQVLSDNGTLQTVRASLATGAAQRRFLRLRVTDPSAP